MKEKMTEFLAQNKEAQKEIQQLNREAIKLRNYIVELFGDKFKKKFVIHLSLSN